MALTRDFIETVKARADKSPKYRRMMLANAVEHLITDEPDVGRLLLRDYVKATMGFEELARLSGLPSPSIKRMLSKSGNPTMNNLAAIIGICQKQEGVSFGVVTSGPKSKKRTLERA